MKDIQYQLTFYSDWHCSSGLSAGGNVDMLVVKDAQGLPYVPGRTIKGLVRESYETLFQPSSLFGAEGAGHTDSKDITVFFSNAELSQHEQTVINTTHTSEFLFRSLSNTAIDECGITKKGSLRKIEVAVPCTLQGSIINVPDEEVENIKNALNYVKRLGLGRSRGLGRCQFVIIQEKGGLQ